LARNINDFAVYTFEDIFPIAFSKKTLIGWLFFKKAHIYLTIIIFYGII
jgi:hypothetical protein